MTNTTILTKTCSKCKLAEPLTTKHFGFDKRHRDGFKSRCRKCCNQDVREYNHRHFNERKKYQQKYQPKYRHTLKGHLQTLFSSVESRCNNSKNQSYKNYGGRGIENKFKSRKEFISYIVDELQIDPRGLQIDRINNNGHYEPGNIRFVTAKENSNNRRNNAT